MDCLPDTVLLCVLKYLNYGDLKRLSLTSTRFGKLCSDPTLWTRFKVKKEAFLDDIPGFTLNRRFRKLKSFELRASKTLLLPLSDLSPLFSFFHSNHHLQCVKFANVDLSSIPGFPFSRGLGHVIQLQLQRCNLSTEQIVALLRALGACQKVLDLSSNNLQHVPTNILSAACAQVKCLDLSLTDLKINQIKEILVNLRMTESLNLGDLDIQELEPDLVASLATKVRSLTLSGVQMSDLQKEILFDSLGSDGSTVDELIDISGVSLACLNSDTLRKGLKGCRSVNIANTWLSHIQIENIINSLEYSSIQELNLASNNCLQLETTDLLTAAVSLKRLDLRSTRLPAETLLEYIDVQGSDDSCKLLVSSSDFYLTKSFLSRLEKAPCVDLVSGTLPYYVDEESCGYGDLLQCDAL